MFIPSPIAPTVDCLDAAKLTMGEQDLHCLVLGHVPCFYRLAQYSETSIYHRFTLGT